MTEQAEFNFVIIGVGCAGCAAVYRLAIEKSGTVVVLEAGPTNRVPQVKIPFGLIWTQGSKRDWKFQTTPQKELGVRRIDVTRGKMLGGSSSINSMAWFRGCRDDFDDWAVSGWPWADLENDCEVVESLLKPTRFAEPHALSDRFGRTLGSNGTTPPTPERESALCQFVQSKRKPK